MVSKRKVAGIIALMMMLNIVLSTPIRVLAQDIEQVGGYILEENFDEYVGSKDEVVHPTGLKISNFVKGSDYTVESQEYYGETASSIKFISKTNGKFLQIYKAYQQAPLIGKIALEATVVLNDKEHERKIAINPIKSKEGDTVVLAPLFSLIEFKADGNITFANNAITLEEKYENDKKYNVKITLDTINQKAKLYLNHELKAETSLPEWALGIGYLRIGQIGNGNSEGHMYLDDVKIYEYIETSIEEPTEPSKPVFKPTTYLLEEDFNSYNGTTTSAGIKFSNVTPDVDYAIESQAYYGDAPNSIKLVSNSSKYLQIYQSFKKGVVQGDLGLEVRASFGDTESERRLFNLNAIRGEITDQFYQMITFKNNGDIKFLNETITLDEKYQADHQYHIKIIIDSETNKAELYLDDVFKVEGDLPAWDGGITNVRLGQVGNGNTESYMYLDDLKIYNYEKSDVVIPEEPGTGEPNIQYLEYFKDAFDKYIGPTVFDNNATSTTLNAFKVYNVVNDKNYITDIKVDGKSGKSLAFVTTTNNIKNSKNQPLSLAREGFVPELTGYVVMEANVYFNDQNVERSIFALRNNATNPAKYTTLFTFKDDGNVYLHGRNSGEIYETDRWYKVGAIMNMDTGAVKYYLDGEELTASGAETPHVDWTQLYSFKFMQEGLVGVDASFYLDDVRIYAGTEFMEEPEDVEVDIEGEIDGWEVRYVAGSPTAEKENVSNLISNESIKLSIYNAGERVSLRKKFPVIGGQNYNFDAMMLIDTPSQVVIGTTVKPLKDGEVIKQDGEDIEYLAHNNIRYDYVKGGWVKNRVYFEAPEEADEILVEYILPGPSTVRVAKTELVERPSWQDVIGKYSSANVSHPMGDDLIKMFLGWQWRAIAEETEATTKAEIASVMAMSDEQLITEAQRDGMKRTHLNVRTPYEAMSRRLAEAYDKTGDEEYARRAIIIMKTLAEGYKDVPRLLQNNDIFHAHGKYIPMESVYAYDLIYNSSEWDSETRDAVEGWFRTSFMHLYNMHDDVYYSNIMPYGIRNAIGLAVTLNDPDMVRMVLPWIDDMFSGKQFSADGMWQEGTVSYGLQVTNNAIEAVKLLHLLYKDPAGYVDNTKYGLELDHTNLMGRWPMLAKSKNLENIMKFPNGAIVGLHDTWTAGQKGETPSKVTNPILEEQLNNKELWHFGHFGLTHGDTKNATQALLTFPPITEGLPYAGGHYHGNHLGIILWGAGMEMLPDSGYPYGPNRFFNMDVQSHNAPWVWNEKAEPYSDRASMYAKPALLAYDDGQKSNKKVQLVEGSSLGADGDLTEMKRRMLVMVETDDNRSYVVDMVRLKGGQAHELFMHAAEDEESTQTINLKTTDYNGMTLDQYMNQSGKTQGLKKWRDRFTNPKVGKGNEDFNFTWTGKESGSALNVFMNAVDDSDAIFSTMPTNRLTENDPNRMDEFPNWSFYRRNIVTEDEVTRFGAVYETVRENEQDKVQSVEWKELDQPDEMSSIAVVDLGDYEDIIYISDDTKERTYNGIKFAGTTAILRKDKTTEEYEWGYVYGQGHIKVDSFSIVGQDDLIFNAVNATEASEHAGENTITVDGEITGENLEGVWLTAQKTDQSGFGMKIEGVNGSTLKVHDTPPVEITSRGVKDTYFPSIEQPETGMLNLHVGDFNYYEPRITAGDLKIQIKQPKFVSTKDPVEPVDPEEPVEPEKPEEKPQEKPSTGESDTNNKPKDEESLNIQLNGKYNVNSNIAKVSQTQFNGLNTTKITIVNKELNDLIAKEGKGIKIELAYNDTKSDSVKVELDGQMVKDMGLNEAVIDFKTINGSYILPLRQIKIDVLKQQMGNNINLEDIKIEIEIAKTTDAQRLQLNEVLAKRKSKIIGEPLSFEVTCSYGDKSIVIDKFERYIEREIVLQENISPEDISTAVKVENDGSLTHVPTRIIQRDGKYYARISSITNSVYTLVHNDKPMTDIKNHWATSDIQDMVDRFIINGTSEGVFEPSKNITRAELTAVIVNALGLKSDTMNLEFTDVKEGKWYYGVIQTAASYGLISGYEDGTFMPNATITREQAMAIIARTIDFIGLDNGVEKDEEALLLEGFTDVKEISNWAKNAVATSVKKGIAKGYNNQVMPKSLITRAESVVMVRRLLKISDFI